MKRIAALLLTAVFLFASPLRTFSDAKSDPLFLSHQFAASSAPEDVFFLIQFPNLSVQRIQAVVLQVPDASQALSSRFIAGVRLNAVPRTGTLSYSVLILGKGNSFDVYPAQQLNLASTKPYDNSSDEITDYLISQKSILASYRVQVQSQEASLRRLRQDAEVIGNFGRVMEVSDEIERLKMDIDNADKSLQTLDSLLKLASTMPAPKNAVGREAQLTSQLSELAQAAKNAEAAELSRKVGMEDVMREKLTVVESSRFEDYDALQRQLDEVRQQRIALEKQKGAVVPVTPVTEVTPIAVGPEVDY